MLTTDKKKWDLIFASNRRRHFARPAGEPSSSSNNLINLHIFNCFSHEVGAAEHIPKTRLHTKQKAKSVSESDCLSLDVEEIIRMSPPPNTCQREKEIDIEGQVDSTEGRKRDRKRTIEREKKKANFKKLQSRSPSKAYSEWHARGQSRPEQKRNGKNSERLSWFWF